MQLDDWLDFIESLHCDNIALGLERSRQVLSRLQAEAVINSVPLIVTIAGTNGKGTTLKLLENAVSMAGQKVAAYTSPHLFRFNERIRLNGQDVADQTLLSAFSLVEQARQDIALTYYEFTTLAAFVIFSQAKVDVWLLEVGLGGRLDTVNLFDADIAVITSIALDHQAFLGNTREAIGFEKAGIARAGSPLFVGGSIDEETPLSIVQHAQELKTVLFDCASRSITLECCSFNASEPSHHTWQLSFSVESAERQQLDHLPYPAIPLANAALGLQVWFALASRLKCSPLIDFTVLLQQTKVFGRFTQVGWWPEVWLDAAHNPAAAQYLALQLQGLPKQGQGKTVALFAIMADKDLIETLKPMLCCIDKWLLFQLTMPRALPVNSIKSGLEALNVSPAAIQCISNVEDYKDFISEQDRCVVFGSFYMLQAFVEQTTRCRK